MEPPPLLYLSEDRERSLIVNIIEHDFKQRYDVPHWLEHSESPFTWMRSLEMMLLSDSRQPDKMHDYKNQGPDYGFEKFTVLLSIMFMKAIEFNEHSDDESDGNDESDGSDKSAESDKESSKVVVDEYFPDSLKKVDPEQAYRMCKAALEEMAAREGDVMYTRIGPAMEHVLQATRAQILFLKRNVVDTREMAVKIKPIEEMSTENLAGMQALKAKFLMSVYQDMRVALETSRKAQELDPTFPAWMYLSAKIMRRIRRDQKGNICEEELELFKRAVELERNPRFIVFLAQSYQEMALSILKGKNRGTKQDAEEMLDKSVELYRECWRLKSDSAAIVRRVGNGMMKMKGHHRDPSLTKEALLKGVELSPCTVTYHSLGKFYLEYERDEEKALEHFQKVGSIYGTGEIIRFNVIKSYPDYDPHEHIQFWIQISGNIVKRDMLYSDIGWYYLVFKNDLFKAVKFFWNILKRDFNSLKVLKFQSFAFCVWGPLNMLKILVNEIKLLNVDGLDCSLEREKIDFFNQFLEKICEKHTELHNLRPDADLLNRCKRDVERYILFLRQQYQRQHQPFYQRRENTTSSWRARNSREFDHNDNNSRDHEESVNRNWNQEGIRRDGFHKRFDNVEESRSYERNHEEGANRNWNQEGIGRDGFSSRFDNCGHRDGMRFNRSQAGTRSYGSDRRHEGTDSQEGSSRFGERDNPSSRFDDRSRGNSRFQRGHDDGNRNMTRGEGRTTDDRRQYGNNYNSNRYDTTITDWRSRSNE